MGIKIEQKKVKKKKKKKVKKKKKKQKKIFFELICNYPSKTFLGSIIAYIVLF